MEYIREAIEIPAFLIYLALMLAAPVNTNFLIYRTCYAVMGKNESDCVKLGLNTTDNATNDLEKEVESYANYISMTLDMVNLVIPCVLCLFVGPWSDKKGRKPILILTIAGIMIASGIKVIVAAVPTMNPWFLLFQVIPFWLSGGIPTFVLIIFCYLIDITNAKNRGLRFGILEGIISIGILMGLYFSASLFALIGYTGVYVLCTGLSVLALFTTVFLLRETVENTNQECNFFSLQNLREVGHATFKKREGYNRFILLVCIVSIIFFVLAENNTGTEILLLRSKFNWELQKITTYITIRSLVAIVGGFFGIYIMHTKLGVPELPLINIALLFCAANTAIMAVAQSDWHLYLATALRILAAVVSPMIRSLLSKILSQSDIAQVFSISVAFESIIAMAGGPLYTLLYTNTINTFPGAFDLIPCFLHITNLAVFIFVLILKQRPNNIVYLSVHEEENISS